MMRFCLAFLLAALALFVQPHAARAQTTDANVTRDLATINSCLTAVDKKTPTQEADEAGCLMKIALPCMGGNEANVSDRRKMDCLDRERAAWDKLLNDSYKTTMAGLEPDQQTKLRDVQRAWVTMRDSTCNFWYDYFPGTMAGPMIAYYNNRETARRAIFLRIFATDVSQRK